MCVGVLVYRLWVCVYVKLTSKEEEEREKKTDVIEGYDVELLAVIFIQDRICRNTKKNQEYNMTDNLNQMAATEVIA